MSDVTSSSDSFVTPKSLRSCNLFQIIFNNEMDRFSMFFHRFCRRVFHELFITANTARRVLLLGGKLAFDYVDNLPPARTFPLVRIL